MSLIRWIGGAALALCVAVASILAPTRARSQPLSLPTLMVISDCASVAYTVGKPTTQYVDTAGRPCSALVNVTISTGASGSITTGGTFQSVLPAGSRRGCLITNDILSPDVLYVGVGSGAPDKGHSQPLGAGASFRCADYPAVSTDQYWVEGDTTGDKFVVWSW